MDPIVYGIAVFFAIMTLDCAVAHARGQRAFFRSDAGPDAETVIPESALAVVLCVCPSGDRLAL